MGELMSQKVAGQLLWAQEWDRPSHTWLINTFDRELILTLEPGLANRLYRDGHLVIGCIIETDAGWHLRHALPVDGITGHAHFALLELHHQLCLPCYHPLLSDLWGFFGSLPSGALRDFYYQILSDESFIRHFFRARASHHHHHQHIGGLLEHSHEVAMTAAMLAMQHQLDPLTVGVAFLGGLLHDAGKLYLYYNQPVSEGVCEQHEALTFLKLHSQLEQLRRRAPRLFEALCGCLTPSDRYAATYLPETIVRMADRLSAEVCNWRRAFADAPSFYWYRKSVDDQRIYKRLNR